MMASWVRSPRQSGVGGERGRGAQIDASPSGFPAEEVGFHLDVAIAEQQDVDAAVQALSVIERVRGFD